MTSLQPDERLSSARLGAYATLAIPISMLMMQLIVYLPPFYAQTVGIDLATVGGIFLLARAWDAFIDPAVGYMSDHTRSRWGRRKPWLAVGIPLLMVGTWAFLQPPEGVGVTYLLVTSFLFYIALTMVQIPYLSLGAELSRQYDERTRITSMREAGTMVGNLVATSVPLLVLASTNPSLQEILGVFAVMVLIGLPIAGVCLLAFTPSGSHQSRSSFRQALKVIPINKPLQRLLIGVFLFWLGGSIFNALVLFVIEYGLGLPSSGFLWLVFTQYITGILGLPVWMWVARTWSRHVALTLGGLAFLGALPLLFLFEGAGLIQCAMLFAGLGLVSSVIWVMPPALVADTIEYGVMRGLGDDAALYMALYNFVQKMAIAIGVGLALPLVAMAGFTPGTENTPTAINNMMMIALCLPVLIALPGGYLLGTYKLDARRHGVVRLYIKRRQQQEISQ